MNPAICGDSAHRGFSSLRHYADAGTFEAAFHRADFSNEQADAFRTTLSVGGTTRLASVSSSDGFHREMPHGLLVRRLSRDEMAQAAIIHRKAFDERLPWLAGLHSPAEDLAFFRDRVFVECELWGAFDDREAVGFIAFRDGWIDQLYVLPHRQNNGVGEALLQIAKSANPSGLRLWTFGRNELARRFYTKRGFIIIDETDGSGNEEHEPDVLYGWQMRESDYARGHDCGCSRVDCTTIDA